MIVVYSMSVIVRRNTMAYNVLCCCCYYCVPTPSLVLSQHRVIQDLACIFKDQHLWKELVTSRPGTTNHQLHKTEPEESLSGQVELYLPLASKCLCVLYIVRQCWSLTTQLSSPMFRMVRQNHSNLNGSSFKDARDKYIITTNKQ